MGGGRGDQMKLVKELRRQGFDVWRTGSGHWKVTNVETGEHVTMSFSPAKTRQHKTIKQLRRIGAEVG